MASIYDKASLVLIPSGTKTSKVYSQKPTNGDGDFTFSRSTAATRVNASGNIEKETQNLLLQSNQFDSATWSKYLSSVSENQTGYDGSSDAWLLSKSGASGRILQSISNSNVSTYSLYAKADTLDWLVLFVLDNSVNPKAYFDLSNGTIGTNNDIIDSSIEDVGNGWYRCSITYNKSITQVRIFPADADGDTSGTSGNIYIQDAQLEQGLVARDYIETTTSAVEGGITDNVPRLDYTDSSCPALLLEPQRTNGILSSEDFTHSSWFTQTGISVVQNTTDTTSPEGVYNAAKITSTSGSFGIYTSAFTTTSPVTRSVYLKGENGGETLKIKDGSGNGGQTNVTLTTEWVRYEHKTTNDGLSYQGMYLDDISTSGAVYAYGAQYEVGSYPTSYIPTYGSAVTRDGDSLTNAGTLEMFDNNEGTLYVEFSALANDGRDNSFRWLISDGTNNDRIQIGLEQNDLLYGSVIVSNVGTSGVDYSLPNPASNHKIAITYTQTKFDLWVDGVKVDTDTNTAIPSGMYRYDFFRIANNNDFVEGNIKQTMYFPIALNDQDMTNLTTL